MASSLATCCCPPGSHDFSCPRHGLKASAEKRASPRKAPTRSKGLKAESAKHRENRGLWKIIKRAMILSQLRTNGQTSCMACGTVNPKPLDLHHIQPAGKGGAWTPENAMLACRTCHDEEHGNAPRWSRNKEAG